MTINQQLSQAQQQLSQGAISAAQEILLGVEAQSPFNAITLTHLIGIGLSRNQLDEVESRLQRWLDPRCALSEPTLAEHMLRLLQRHSMLKAAMQVADKIRLVFPQEVALVGQCVALCREARANQTGLSWLAEAKLDISHQSGVLRLRASLLSMQGEFEQAIEDYQRLLQLDPNDSFAMAGLSKTKRFGIAELPMLEHMAKAKATKADASERARIGFAMAKILNDAKQYDEAWHVALEANADKRKTCVFDAQQLKTQIDGMLSVFDNLDWHQYCGSSQAEHVFVVGMPRSGTTLIEQILSVLPEYYAGGETPAIEFAMGQVEHGNHYLQRLHGHGTVDFDAMASAYERYFSQFANYSGRVIINKVPTNFFHVGLIKLMFPKAKIINMSRNPLDLACSIVFENFSEHFAYTNDLDDIFFVYDQYQRLMTCWRGLFGNDILDVSYQSLVTQYAECVGLVGRFLNAEMPSIDKIRDSKNPVETPSIWQVRQPINSTAVERWRHYEPHFVKYKKRYS